MRDWIKKMKPWLGILPACVLLVCVCVSLSGYEMPVFEVDAAQGITEEMVVEDIDEKTTEESIDLEDIAVALPPTTERPGPDPGASKKVEEQKDADAYKNGTYYGTGSGFGGELKVKVVIKKGKIKKITIVESKDDTYYINAASALLEQIIKKQSTNVDVVSGATYSSAGLIEAVRDALKDAEVKKKKKKKKTTEATTETTETNKETVPEGTIPYNDGVYYGTGEGYRGDIKVAVCISNKTIRYIQIIESEDDESFFTKAKVLVNEVIKKQSTNVDVISGATYSSNGILEAVVNALAEAKRITEGGSPTTETTTEKPTTENLTIESSTSEVPSTEVDGSEVESEAPLIYQDGTYTLEVVCNPDSNYDFEPYTLSVTVTIKNDKVISVTDVKGVGDYDTSNDWYILRALNGTSKYKGVAMQITEKGNAEQIDAVSGATCSSNAVIQAVQAMLNNAKKSEEGQVNE